MTNEDKALKIIVKGSYELIREYPCPGCGEPVATKIWHKHENAHDLTCWDKGGCGESFDWDHEKQEWNQEKNRFIPRMKWRDYE